MTFSCWNSDLRRIRFRLYCRLSSVEKVCCRLVLMVFRVAVIFLIVGVCGICGKTLYQMMGTYFLFAEFIAVYNLSISFSMSIAFLFCRDPCWYVDSSVLNSSHLAFLKE